MKSEPARTLRLRRDAGALAANWRTLDAMSGPAAAGAAVKADAYGIGADFAVPVLRDAGCSAFFVAHWSEVADVIAHVPAEQVSVLHGPLTGEDCAYARACGVRPVINSLVQAQLWLESGGGLCDLMIDTGINRLGLAADETADPLVARLEIYTIMSHLACADEDHPLNEKQLGPAQSLFAAIPARRRSLANSAGIARGQDYAFDLTRPGISLYGGAQVPALAGSILAVSHGLAVAGFGLIAAGAFLARAGAELARLRRVPFSGPGRAAALHSALPWLVDAAIFACAVLAMEGEWLHRLFPPLVLLGMLYAVRSGARTAWAAVPSDRGALALGLAVASGFDVLEPVVMLFAIGLIALNLAKSGATSG